MILCLNFCTPDASAQESGVGAWYGYFGNQPLGEKWNWVNEAQYRSYNAIGDLQQVLVRTGFGYSFSERNNTLLFGLAYVRTENYIEGTSRKQPVDDRRLFQQFLTRQQFGRVYVQHRYRIEERFIDRDFRMRFRYFLGVNIALSKPRMDPKAFYLALYDEIFINGDRNLFDRNRIAASLGFVISKYLRVEAGMMEQNLEHSDRAQFLLSFYNNLPISVSRKKK